MPSLEPLKVPLGQAVTMLENCYNAGNKILTCGNGGSAADAEHIIGELMKGFLLKRPISHVTEKILTEGGLDSNIRQKLQSGIPAISLVSGISLPTAFANDVDPAYIYGQQVFVLGKPGDVLIAISTSGNSPNIVIAAKIAEAMKLKVIGLTGANHSALAEISDVLLQAPHTETAQIQELHIAIYHAICAQLEHELFN